MSCKPCTLLPASVINPKCQFQKHQCLIGSSEGKHLDQHQARLRALLLLARLFILSTTIAASSSPSSPESLLFFYIPLHAPACNLFCGTTRFLRMKSLSGSFVAASSCYCCCCCDFTRYFKTRAKLFIKIYMCASKKLQSLLPYSCDFLATLVPS